jgi:hypothetical protein
MRPDGDVDKVLIEGVPQSAFEVEHPNVEVASRCKYCDAAITANDAYWTKGEHFTDWYSTDDMCCAPNYRRPHEPSLITTKINEPHVQRRINQER